MELRQLEYFVAVAEEANFTRAAERVHISQSGVSAQLRQLERELGAALIDRSGRRATLTGAGAAALEHARAALGSAASVRQAVGDVSEVIRGRLAVGMVTACTITGLFDALSAFHAAHPGVDIALGEDHSDRLVDRVRAGTLELALVGAADGPIDGLETLPIVTERIVAAVPTDHALAKHRTLKLADLGRFSVIGLPQGAGIRTVFDQACLARGVRLDIALEASAPATVADLALRGLGVAVLSESIVASYGDRLVAIPISDVKGRAALYLVWKPGPSPAVRRLLVHCRAAFGVSA